MSVTLITTVIRIKVITKDDLKKPTFGSDVAKKNAIKICISLLNDAYVLAIQLNIIPYSYVDLE